jgi:hypothetical protein
MVYKILSGDFVTPPDRYITAGDPRTRGGHRLWEIPPFKNVYKYSSIRTVKQWNHLPTEIATPAIVDGFTGVQGHVRQATAGP